MEQHALSAQKLPAGLAGVLNTPEGNRDSAYYSSTDASSKRAYSLATVALVDESRLLTRAL